MRYLGGKHYILKDIKPIILGYRASDEQIFYDIFCGSGKVSEGVSGKVIAVDHHKPIIDALILIRDSPHVLPKNNTEFTKEDYLRYKHSKGIGVAPGLYGYIGYAGSFGGVFYSGWATNKRNEDALQEAYNSSLRQSPRIQHIKYICCDYRDIDIIEGSLVYCDPPYLGKSRVGSEKVFDYPIFYQWCEDLVRHKACTVLVSENTAPIHWVCLWEKQLPQAMRGTRQQKANMRYERLYLVSLPQLTSGSSLI